ncbi:MAG: hypothetical protein EBX13_05370 [Proteobacteria bacterium]|nr:hypothetical protein [Pseudomonadota bacterium]
MSTFIAAFIVTLVAFSALAIGLIIRNKPIEGSCGGVMTSEDGTCSICGKTEINSCTKTDS